jgi:hypothetical protein
LLKLPFSYSRLSAVFTTTSALSAPVRLSHYPPYTYTTSSFGISFSTFTAYPSGFINLFFTDLFTFKAAVRVRTSFSASYAWQYPLVPAA